MIWNCYSPVVLQNQQKQRYFHSHLIFFSYIFKEKDYTEENVVAIEVEGVNIQHSAEQTHEENKEEETEVQKEKNKEENKKRLKRKKKEEKKKVSKKDKEEEEEEEEEEAYDNLEEVVADYMKEQ